ASRTLNDSLIRFALLMPKLLWQYSPTIGAINYFLTHVSHLLLNLLSERKKREIVCGETPKWEYSHVCEYPSPFPGAIFVYF
ncbi:MAG: hypothetical protein QXJ76_01970, partial [Candidatus Bathyarchaeia archaeon]